LIISPYFIDGLKRLSGNGWTIGGNVIPFLYSSLFWSDSRWVGWRAACHASSAFRLRLSETPDRLP
jgi:hypothetical protein